MSHSSDCRACAAGRRRSLPCEQFLGAHPRQHRCRLRRHRHQPALCRARVGDRGGRRECAGERAGGARHLVADHLGAASGGHRQIRADPAARRQQGGGRHAGADGARLARALRQDRRRGAARHHQRRAVLRRRHHHAGAVGVVGDRGPEGDDARLQRLRGADHGGDPGGAVHGAVARHRQGGGLFRADHARLVRRARLDRRLAHRARIRWCCWPSIPGTACTS